MNGKKTVLVTGGARGIGESISRAFAAAGYRVFIHCDESAEAAKALCAELGDAEYFRADLSKPEGVRALFEASGAPDVLVNNAGIALVKPFDAVSAPEAEKLYALDLFAPIELARLCAPAMISRKSGCIINISSVFGESGGSCAVDYSAAKAGLIGFTKALAKELGPSGIRVNCVCPGVIDTEMNDDLSFEDVESLTGEIPLCRMGRAEEIAAAAVFLAGENAEYITGAVLDVNGGWQG
jgi:3-oxoacyl-[acyl-carrier protein] reductase